MQSLILLINTFLFILMNVETKEYILSELKLLAIKEEEHLLKLLFSIEPPDPPLSQVK